MATATLAMRTLNLSRRGPRAAKGMGTATATVVTRTADAVAHALSSAWR
jgi:hypothetical protein